MNFLFCSIESGKREGKGNQKGSWDVQRVAREEGERDALSSSSMLFIQPREQAASTRSQAVLGEKEASRVLEVSMGAGSWRREEGLLMEKPMRAGKGSCLEETF